MRILNELFWVLCSLELINLFCIPTILIVIKIKTKYSNMTTQSWENYFQKMTMKQFKKKCYFIGILAVILVSFGSYIILKSMQLCCIIFILGLLNIYIKVYKNFPTIIEKIDIQKKS